ncbi:MAG: class I SAM-dependent methyltransferase [Nitriliruptor sp.]|nr:MAG: class I SAM-dependent methyltransferase [Nitriliruptor sp.]
MRWLRRRRASRFPAITDASPLLPEAVWRPLVAEHLDAGQPSGWWEPVYATAVAQGRRLPWQEGTVHPWVAGWLEDPVYAPPGSRALVVGCGVGDDIVPLLERGYDVTAMDVSHTAIAWAQHRVRALVGGDVQPVRWLVADLLEVSATEVGAFDLVVEVHTVPWLPGVVRDAAMAAIGGLVAPGGVALVITEVATSEAGRATHEGPAWAQAPSELAAYRAGGLVRLAIEHPSPGDAPTMEVRMTWQRARGAPVGGSLDAGLPLLDG